MARGPRFGSLPPLSVYVHLPWCVRKCPYCDFNTYAGLSDWFERTVSALCAELARWQETLARPHIDGAAPPSVTVGPACADRDHGHGHDAVLDRAHTAEGDLADVGP